MHIELFKYLLIIPSFYPAQYFSLSVCLSVSVFGFISFIRFVLKENSFLDIFIFIFTIAVAAVTKSESLASDDENKPCSSLQLRPFQIKQEDEVDDDDDDTAMPTQCSSLLTRDADHQLDRDAISRESIAVNSADVNAIIALQQLASISSASSYERLINKLPSELADNIDLQGVPRKLPRLSTKRISQINANNCPLCKRVYRTQAHLNEHMRKEHSVLI